MKRNLKVCKFCYAKRVIANPPKSPLEAVLAQNILEGGMQGWEPCYCHISMENRKPPPEECPYITEHAVTEE